MGRPFFVAILRQGEWLQLLIYKPEAAHKPRPLYPAPGLRWRWCHRPWPVRPECHRSNLPTYYQRKQEEVVFGTTRDDVVTAINKHLGHCLSVLNYLLLIGFELGFHSLFETDRFGGDYVHQGATLAAGENR